MPSPRITRHKRPKPPLPPRARQLAELMVDEGLSLDECGERMAIGKNTVRTYFRLPAFHAYRLQCLADLRNAEAAKNVKVVAGIRDKSAKKPSAAHGRVAIEAARYIDGEKASGVTVNLGVGIGVGVAGYLVDVSGHVEAAEDIIRRAKTRAPMVIEAEPQPEPSRPQQIVRFRRPETAFSGPAFHPRRDQSG